MSPSRSKMMRRRNRASFALLMAILVVLMCAPGASAFAVPPTTSRRFVQGSKLYMSTSATPTSVNQTEQVSTESKAQKLQQQQALTYRTNLEIGKLADAAPNNATAALAAQRLLSELPHPDTVTYNGVLKALAKSASLDGAQQAQDLLEEMEEIFENESRANQEWYAQMDEESLKEGDAPRISVKPNVRSYSTVMDAWSQRSGKVPQAALRAQKILERLEHLYETTGDLCYEPNTISFNTVIAAWAKDGGQAGQAQLLLKKMGARADVISFNTVLLAWARSGLPEAGERAEALLREMKTVNARSYTTVIDAWSRCHAFHYDSAERANALLQEMEDRYEKTQDVTIRPNCFSYSTVINAYALSKDINKAQKAWNILQHMRELSDSGRNVHAKPSQVTYNSVLNACGASMPVVQQQVKPMVHNLYREIMTNPNLQADHYTYGTVLKACANVFCGEEDNDEFVESVFDECCKDGQVSFGVCYQLRQAASSELYRKLIPDEAYNPVNGHFSVQDMPAQWTRNVRERRARDSIDRSKARS